jgi:16S rRNA (guanine966-N2)-methyltransferase
MKIIAGKFKGRNLAYRERRGLRVTSQKVKEAIFGMIGGLIEGSQVMDLFCGYGSLGLEAISRGASHVTFVDVDFQAFKQLSFFLEKLELESQATMVKRDAIKVIKHQQPESFNIVLMDPPYHIKMEEKTLEAVDKEKILKPGGMCIVEHSSETELPESVGGLVKKKNRVYGDTAVTIYILKGEDTKLGEIVHEATTEEIQLNAMAAKKAELEKDPVEPKMAEEKLPVEPKTAEETDNGANITEEPRIDNI